MKDGVNLFKKEDQKYSKIIKKIKDQKTYIKKHKF